MRNPELDTSQLFQNFLNVNPNISKIIGCPKSALDQISQSLKFGLTGVPEGRPEEDESGKFIVPSGQEWSFRLVNHPQRQVYEMRIHGLDGSKSKIVMIGTAALGEGNYKAIAMASQVEEKLPIKPQESVLGRILNGIGRATTYSVTPKGDRYHLTIDRPGQLRSEEVWQEVAKRFTYGTDSFWVVAKIPDSVNQPSSKPRA